MKWHSGPPPHVLRELFSYDAATGVLVWQQPRGSRVWAGKIAGTAHDRGYLRVQLSGSNLYVHRVIWAMTHDEWPEQIDHINGDRRDNRLVNLRAATNAQNCSNITRPRSTNTGHPNIYFDHRYGTYRVNIRVAGRLRVKSFKSLQDAIPHRDAMREQATAHYWPAGARVPRVEP